MIIKTCATKTVKVVNERVIWEKTNQSITISLDDEHLSLSELDVIQNKILHTLTRAKS